jgi:hypothetical protein
MRNLDFVTPPFVLDLLVAGGVLLVEGVRGERGRGGSVCLGAIIRSVEWTVMV